MDKTTMFGCPVDLDERTELYCLSRLSVGEARRFEAHLAICPACLSEAMETDLFLKSLMRALRELGQEKLQAEHQKRPAGLEDYRLVRVVSREEWILTGAKIRAIQSDAHPSKVNMKKVAKQLRRN